MFIFLLSPLSGGPFTILDFMKSEASQKEKALNQNMFLSAFTVNLFIFISGASLINMATNLLSYLTKVRR